jgi:hypothetical protein
VKARRRDSFGAQSPFGSCSHWRSERPRISSGPIRPHTCRAFVRNHAFAISTIGLDEAGRPSDELLALVRGWIERVFRYGAKVWDYIPCRHMLASRVGLPSPCTLRNAIYSRRLLARATVFCQILIGRGRGVELRVSLRGNQQAGAFRARRANSNLASE